MGTHKNRLIEAVLMSTHNLCYRAKIRKNVYLCKPQFYYIKVGCKGVHMYTLHGHVSMMTFRNSIMYIETLNKITVIQENELFGLKLLLAVGKNLNITT